jgi:DNA repair exonuclease SbcCD ATPase subunit
MAKQIPAPAELLEAAEHVARFLRTFNGLKRAMEFLEQHGSILQAASEAEARRDRAIAEADQADARAAAAKADAIKADAAAKAAIAAGAAKAGMIEAQAREDGDKFVDDARREAARITDAAAATKAAAEASLRATQQAIVEVQREHDDVAKRLAVLKGELEAIKARLGG